MKLELLHDTGHLRWWHID